MKKSITVLGLIVLILLIACASTESGNETGLSLEEAIEQSAAEITSRLPAGTRVAIAAFDSEHQNLSNYIMDELSGTLTGSSLEVTDRRNLDFVYKELGFQMTGDVSDETAASIGKFLGAQYVITGQFLKTGGNYRYRVSGINVETAVQESSSRLDVRNSRSFQSLLADLRSAKVTAPTAYSRPTSPPGTAGAFLDRGILFAIRGDWELAIADFTEAIKLDTTLAAAWAFRGRALIASVSFILEIEEDFSDFVVIAVDAKNITAEQKAGYNKAIADYTQAINLNPNFAPAYRDRGIAYSYSGDYDKALADFNQALRLNPNDPTVYRERGNIYGFQGDDTRALADYNRSINVSPDRRGAYNNRGNVYRRMGDNDRAIADYTHAIRLNPNELLAYSNRGLAYLDKKEYDRAIADFNQAIRINANYENAYFGRGHAYLNKKEYDRAIADYNQVIRINPNNAWAYNDRGFAYINKGNWDQAIADYNQAIRLNPNNAWVYNDRGSAYANKGNWDQAIADYEAALRIEPNHTFAKDNLEKARRAKGW
jgi:tetratricopeptide (TPR) repeat protein